MYIQSVYLEIETLCALPLSFDSFMFTFNMLFITGVYVGVKHA